MKVKVIGTQKKPQVQITLTPAEAAAVAYINTYGLEHNLNKKHLANFKKLGLIVGEVDYLLDEAPEVVFKREWSTIGNGLKVEHLDE